MNIQEFRIFGSVCDNNEILFFDKNETDYEVEENGVIYFEAKRLDDDLYISKITHVYISNINYITEQFNKTYINKYACDDIRIKKALRRYISADYDISEDEKHFILCKKF